MHSKLITRCIRETWCTDVDVGVDVPEAPGLPPVVEYNLVYTHLSGFGPTSSTDTSLFLPTLALKAICHGVIGLGKVYQKKVFCTDTTIFE